MVQDGSAPWEDLVLAPLVAAHPYLDVDPLGFATEPDLVRVFLARRTSAEPLHDQWLRFKSLLREHASALWYVDPVEVGALIRGADAHRLLRDAWTRRLAPAAFGTRLSSLWYAHATSSMWSATTSAALDVHVRVHLAALADADDDEVAPTRAIVAGATDTLGNQLLGSAAALALHGADAHHLNAVLHQVLQLVKDGDGVDELRRCLKHTNGVHESTRSMLRRLPQPQRDAVRMGLMDHINAHLLLLGKGSDARFAALAEARAFVQDEATALGPN